MDNADPRSDCVPSRPIWTLHCPCNAGHVSHCMLKVFNNPCQKYAFKLDKPQPNI